MALREVLDQIDALAGMEEFKQFCARLVRTADNIKSLRLDAVPIPNLIFAAAPGCGVTLHIRLLTDLMRELKLMRFVGEEECFEWAMNVDDRDSLNYLILRTQRAAGFYGQFRGIVGLDVKALIRDADGSPALERLMEFVDSHEGSILFVFIIPFSTPEDVQKRLMGRFASHTPVELIHMPFPQAEAQYYITDQLFSRGFNVTQAAQTALKKAVKTLSASPEFEGYQTLQNLTDEIVWRKVSQQMPMDDTVTARDVQFILGENGYCAALNAHGVRPARRRMGFGEGGEGRV